MTCSKWEFAARLITKWQVSNRRHNEMQLKNHLFGFGPCSFFNWNSKRRMRQMRRTVYFQNRINLRIITDVRNTVLNAASHEIHTRMPMLRENTAEGTFQTFCCFFLFVFTLLHALNFVSRIIIIIKANKLRFAAYQPSDFEWADMCRLHANTN